MMSYKCLIWNIANTASVVGIIVFLVVQKVEKSPQVYVVNQEIFNGFRGREDLNIKLESVKERHKQILDSIYVKIKNDKDDEGLNSLAVKSEEFLLEEQQLSERYTQQVWKQINTYMNEYGVKNEYDLIFGANGSGSLMYADEAINITDDVLEYINSRYDGEE